MELIVAADIMFVAFCFTKPQQSMPLQARIADQKMEEKFENHYAQHKTIASHFMGIRNGLSEIE